MRSFGAWQPRASCRRQPEITLCDFKFEVFPVVTDARVPSDKLDARAVRWCFREALVAGEKRCIERFSKGDVYGVVRGKVVSQVPNARHQDAVRIPGEWEVGEVLQRS